MKIPFIGGRGPERTGAGTVINPPPSNDTLREGLIRAYIYGDELVRATLSWPTPQENKPLLQAQATLHRLLNDALTGYGGRTLREVIMNPNGAEYKPGVNLSVPVHNAHGEPQKDPNGTHRSVRVSLLLPLCFIQDRLRKHASPRSAQALEENSTDVLQIPKSLFPDVVRLVAERMSKNYDHGAEQNWLLSERALREALAGRAFRLPSVR